MSETRRAPSAPDETRTSEKTTRRIRPAAPVAADSTRRAVPRVIDDEPPARRPYTGPGSGVRPSE